VSSLFLSLLGNLKERETDVISSFAKGNTLQLKVLSGVWHSTQAGRLLMQVISIDTTGSYLCSGNLLLNSQVLGRGLTIKALVSKFCHFVLSWVESQQIVPISLISSISLLDPFLILHQQNLIMSFTVPIVTNALMQNLALHLGSNEKYYWYFMVNDHRMSVMASE
jgi:hypothetical protein